MKPYISNVTSLLLFILPHYIKFHEISELDISKKIIPKKKKELRV